MTITNVGLSLFDDNVVLLQFNGIWIEYNYNSIYFTTKTRFRAWLRRDMYDWLNGNIIY